LSKLPAPNYTQIPNALLAMIPEMGHAELKVVLAVARETFGWRREWKQLSFSRLEALTGLSRESVSKGIEAAIARGVMERKEEGLGFTYHLLIHDQIAPEQDEENTETAAPDQSGKPTSQVNRLVGKTDQNQSGKPTSTSQVNRPVLVGKTDQLRPESGNGSKQLQRPKESIKESIKKVKESMGANAPASAGSASQGARAKCPRCSASVPLHSSDVGDVAICLTCGIDALQPLPPDADSDAAKCVAFYKHRFNERFNEQPRITKGKDFGIIRDLIGQYGKARVQELLRAYVNSDDARVKEAGYSIAFFPSRINSLIVAGNGTAAVFGCDECLNDAERVKVKQDLGWRYEVERQRFIPCRCNPAHPKHPEHEVWKQRKVNGKTHGQGQAANRNRA
jgi:phage replication O-like protein O